MLPQRVGDQVTAGQTLATLDTSDLQAQLQQAQSTLASAQAAYNKASATHTLVEVTGRDRRGLMHFLTRALTAQNLQISTAKISTFGHRVVDVFYVKDQFGLKVECESRLKAIRDALIQVLQEREAEIAPPVVESKAPAAQ